MHLQKRIKVFCEHHDFRHLFSQNKCKEEKNLLAKNKVFEV